jgi:hypothetical protein
VQFGFGFGVLVVAGLEADCDEDGVCETSDAGTTARTNRETMHRIRNTERNGIKVLFLTSGHQTSGVTGPLDQRRLCTVTVVSAAIPFLM